MNAFSGIATTGNATLATVAPHRRGLVATAAGLAAAIPSVMAYNYFLSRIRAIHTRINSFTSESSTSSSARSRRGDAMAMMSSSSRAGDRRVMAEINVTPLVDVMLVLLIIFMVTAPMLTQGVDVNLPQASAKAMRSDEERLVIT